MSIDDGAVATIDKMMAESGVTALVEDSSTEDVMRALGRLSGAAGRLEREGLLYLQQLVQQKLKGLKNVSRPAALMDHYFKASPNRPTPESVVISTPTPCDEPVDGDELLGDLVNAIRKFVMMLEFQAVAVALWILHTHLADLEEVFPRLAIQAPDKRCGKTTLLRVIARLVRKPLPVANTTPAATFRVLDAEHPTLLVDEVDTFLKEQAELRGVLNAGHDVDGGVLRCVTTDQEVIVRVFDCHGPVALAGISRLPDTLQDRSIVIGLKRRKKTEEIARFRRRQAAALAPLASRCARWAQDNGDAYAEVPYEELNLESDRAADNWEPLFKVARLIGESWPQKAMDAARALEHDGAEVDDAGLAVRLLGDIRVVTRREEADWHLSMGALCERLNGLDEAPWSDLRGGKGINARGLGKLLRDFGIRSRTGRLPDGASSKCIYGAALEEAFERYLPTGPVTPVTSLNSNEFSRDQGIGETTAGETSGHGKSTCDPADVTGVTGESGDGGPQKPPEGSR